jgi:septal ring factor EnvC (AmiA/AmiB activator)
MHRRMRTYIPVTTLALLAALFGATAVWAETATPEEIRQLQSEIQNRKAQIETINQRLEDYKKKIAEYSKLASSLQNDIAILENEAAMTELDIAATQNAIEEENLHLSILDANIEDADTKLAKDKELLTELLLQLTNKISRAVPLR